MFNLVSMDLDRIVFIKKVKLRFVKGLTFIQGRNLNRRGPNASNGAGKSLLMGTLPNLIFDTHPSITKNARSVQKKIYEKGSSAALTFNKNKHDFVFTKTSSTASITRDGKPMKSRLAKDNLRALLDYTEEEFFNTVYIDSRRPASFQMGTSSERFNFITNLFRLHDMDELRKQFNREVNSLKSDSTMQARLKEDLDAVNIELEALPKQSKELALETSRALEAANDELNDLGAKIARLDQWKKFQKVTAELDAIKRPKLSRKEVRKAIKEHQEHAAAVAQYEKTAKRLTELQAELAEIHITEQHVSEYAHMCEVRDSLRKVDEPIKPEMSLKKALKLCEGKKTDATHDKAKQLERDVKEKKRELSEFDDALAHETTCPTCYSKLSKETKATIRKALVDAIDISATNAVNMWLRHEACVARDAWATYETELADYTAYVTVRAEVKAFPFDEVENWRELRRKRQAINLEPVSECNVKIDRMNEALETWDRIDHLQRLFDALKMEDPGVKADTAEARHAELKKKVTKLMDRLPKLQSTADQRVQCLKRKKKLQEEIADIDRMLLDLPVYEMLSEAYSTKGVKLLMVKRIGAALEKTLNKNSRQIFAEEFDFTFDIADNKFDVIVTRKSAERNTSSDIRMFSGAEGRMFVFAFLLALLPLIPDSRRCNTLIMDEPDANLDSETRDVFRDVLLPMLQRIVPCVVVVSPNKEIVPQHARVFTIVKQGSESKLVKGVVP